MLREVEMSKNWNDKENFSKIVKFYRFYCIVAKVQLAVTREISWFLLKEVDFFDASFLCIILYATEYFFIFGK